MNLATGGMEWKRPASTTGLESLENLAARWPDCVIIQLLLFGILDVFNQIFEIVRYDAILNSIFDHF